MSIGLHWITVEHCKGSVFYTVDYVDYIGVYLRQFWGEYDGIRGGIRLVFGKTRMKSP